MDFLAQESHRCRPYGNVQNSVKELDLLSTSNYELDSYDSENSAAVIYVSMLKVSGTPYQACGGALIIYSQ